MKQQSLARDFGLATVRSASIIRDSPLRTMREQCRLFSLRRDITHVCACFWDLFRSASKWFLIEFSDLKFEISVMSNLANCQSERTFSAPRWTKRHSRHILSSRFPRRPISKAIFSIQLRFEIYASNSSFSRIVGYDGKPNRWRDSGNSWGGRAGRRVEM